jgi:hypothetical protein
MGIRWNWGEDQIKRTEGEKKSRVGKGSTDDETTCAEPWPVQEKVTPLSISNLIRHRKHCPGTVHFCLIRKGAPPIAVSRCLRDRSAPVGGDMSPLAAESMSGVRRLASSSIVLLDAYYHPAGCGADTWGNSVMLVVILPVRRRKTAKFTSDVSTQRPHQHIPTAKQLLHVLRSTYTTRRHYPDQNNMPESISDFARIH